jgi:hypothetical protein
MTFLVYRHLQEVTGAGKSVLVNAGSQLTKSEIARGAREKTSSIFIDRDHIIEVEPAWTTAAAQNPECLEV